MRHSLGKAERHDADSCARHCGNCRGAGHDGCPSGEHIVDQQHVLSQQPFLPPYLEEAAHVAKPFPPSEFRLACLEGLATDAARIYRYARERAHPCRHLGALVVATLAEPLPCQRHRHYDIHAVEEAGRHELAGGKPSQRYADVGAPFVLQRVYHAAHLRMGFEIEKRRRTLHVGLAPESLGHGVVVWPEAEAGAGQPEAAGRTQRVLGDRQPAAADGAQPRRHEVEHPTPQTHPHSPRRCRRARRCSGV